MLRRLLATLTSSSRPAPRKPGHRPGTRLRVEALEDRIVPSNEYAWIGPTGGSTAVGANWEDEIAHTTGTVPGPGDYVDFASAWANTSCTVAGTLSVDRVIMDSTYTATLTVPTGAAIDCTTEFQSSGTLVLSGGTIATESSAVYLNGTVDATAAGSAITAGTTMALNGPLTVSAGTEADPGLTLTSGKISIANNITVSGSGGGGAALTIVGNVPTMGFSDTITVSSGSYLGFSPGTQGALFDMTGTLDLASGSTFATGDATRIDSGTGTMNVLAAGGTATVVGRLTVLNAAQVNVANSENPGSTLDMEGTLDDQATVNLNATGTLSFAGAATGTQFLVSGQVNMYGAGITNGGPGVTAVPVDITTGKLTTYGSSSGGKDTITGDLINDYLVQFEGSMLHTLSVGGNYTQGSGGGLDLRIEMYGIPNDLLAVGGSASLDGALSVTAVGSVMQGPTWKIITTNLGISGDFTSKAIPAPLTTAQVTPDQLSYEVF